MPKIFDNIDQHLLPTLSAAMGLSERGDFCVGYFNLRGWRQIDEYVERWDGGERHCCRLLVGMQKAPEEQLRSLMATSTDEEIDNAKAIQLKRQLAQEFRQQLTYGIPTAADEAGLRRLAEQINTGKLVVKLFVRHTLHAKLYLLFRQDAINPKMGYLGSSNLTMSGLKKQGELNIDVLDQDACDKLAKWFEDRWTDRFCLDISKDLVEIINESWARPEVIPPYQIYVKTAWHLSQEARAGLSEFRIPSDFGNTLFEFQKAAVKIAAHHLNKRGGVVIGDVVGLGKTLMATALARIFEDDHNLETLILCPKNLVKMWEDYRVRYRLRAKVLSVTRAQAELPTLSRFRLVLIDESHNLRNREGKRYRVIAEYISRNDSRVMLLSATPYNKTYLDLSNQLRLFIDESKDIGIRPERLLRDLGEVEFIKRHQAPVRSLAAFEKSTHADDWRDLMRLYATKAAARKAFTEGAAGQGKLMLGDADEAYKKFEEDAEVVERAFRQFREQQTKHGGKITVEHKQQLREKLAKLDGELDRFLAAEYGIKSNKRGALEEWRSSKAVQLSLYPIVWSFGNQTTEPLDTASLPNISPPFFTRKSTSAFPRSRLGTSNETSCAIS